jgi:hypothetical protein
MNAQREILKVSKKVGGKFVEIKCQNELATFHKNKEFYNDWSNNCSDELNSFINNFCKENKLTVVAGLIPDECCKTETYKSLSLQFNRSFAALRDFNGQYKVSYGRFIINKNISK